MTTALSDAKTSRAPFMKGQGEAYLPKPVNKEKLVEQLQQLNLINEAEPQIVL